MTDNVVVETAAYEYKGQVRTGTQTRHGRGTCTWKGAHSGYMYEGGWSDDERSGQGVFTLPDGQRYEGEYKDDKKSGQGVHTWLDGQRYEGEWKDGRGPAKG